MRDNEDEIMTGIRDCRKFIECLSAHFDGELPEDLLVEFEKHLRYCENARAVVRTFERTIILHRGGGGTPVPEDVHARLLRAIEECRGEEGS
jgi:anti-sigma factor RsiW